MIAGDLDQTIKVPMVGPSTTKLICGRARTTV
jgi:hypothetical protein